METERSKKTETEETVTTSIPEPEVTTEDNDDPKVSKEDVKNAVDNA